MNRNGLGDDKSFGSSSEGVRNYVHLGEKRSFYGKDDSRSNNGVGNRRTAACKTCIEKGIDRCFHCKKCGGLNHFAQYCLQSSKDQGLLN